MYYGFYTNSTIQHGDDAASYDMPLAYIFTIGACLTICFFSLLFRYGGSAFLDSKLFFRFRRNLRDSKVTSETVSLSSV